MPGSKGRNDTRLKGRNKGIIQIAAIPELIPYTLPALRSECNGFHLNTFFSADLFFEIAHSNYFLRH